MHLHSRRLRIDHPDGGAIDISAELPEHFAASIDALGFDLLLGDVGIDSGEKGPPPKAALKAQAKRSEEHTSELQSLMRISYAVFCLKKKKQTINNTQTQH